MKNRSLCFLFLAATWLPSSAVLADSDENCGDKVSLHVDGKLEWSRDVHDLADWERFSVVSLPKSWGGLAGARLDALLATFPGATAIGISGCGGQRMVLSKAEDKESLEQLHFVVKQDDVLKLVRTRGLAVLRVGKRVTDILIFTGKEKPDEDLLPKRGGSGGAGDAGRRGGGDGNGGGRERKNRSGDRGGAE